MTTTLEAPPESPAPPDQVNTGIQLSEEQEQAKEQVLDWFNEGEKQEFRLGGYAGTGKTTLVQAILDEIEDQGDIVLVCAPTGKAANVLRRKGIADAKTIHSAIYRPATPESDNWELRRPDEIDADLFVVDEASMVSTELYQHLLSFNRPILFVGDPGQLEPVGDNPNLMGSPDFVLQKIHRQAEGNPILQLAQAVREGSVPKPGYRSPQLVMTTWPLPMKNLLQADQILCGTNAVRRNWNTVIRAEKGMPSDCLVGVGEKLIVLRNDHKLHVFNGQLITVTKVRHESEDAIYVNAVDDTGDNHFWDLRLWKPGLLGATPSRDHRMPRKTAHVDYGYVITCHKSQGSEWDNVVVIDPGIIGTWDMRRWRYTAITRAAKALIYCQ